MKKLLFITFVMFSLTSCFTLQQVTFNEDEFVKTYDDVSGTKNDLYLKANEWMVSIFKDAKSVIQHSDKEEGAILGKYLMKSLITGPGLYGTTSVTTTDIYAKIDIRVKDGKARLSIVPYNYAYLSAVPYTKESAIADIELLSESFHKALLAKKIDF